MAKKKPVWIDEPEDHDFPAAFDYLTLVMTPSVANRVVIKLRQSSSTVRKAKDILRAADLPLLPKDNKHVLSDLAKVASGRRLSPVLLVRGNALSGRPLAVADGYHRVCASYWIDENTDIPCRLVDASENTRK